MIEFIVSFPPPVGYLVVAGQTIVTFGARKIVVLGDVFFLVDHRDEHPPATCLLAAEKDQFAECAGHGDAVLTVVLLAFEPDVVGTVEESLHKIPDDMGDELGGLVTVIHGGIILVDAE